MTRTQEKMLEVIRQKPDLALNLWVAIYRFDCEFNFAEAISNESQELFAEPVTADAARQDVCEALGELNHQLSMYTGVPIGDAQPEIMEAIR